MAEIKIENIEPNTFSYKKEKEKEKERERKGPLIDRDKIVSTQKKGFEKIIDSFIDGNMKERLLDDVIVPGIQNAILNSLSMLFFGRSADIKDFSRRGTNDRYNDYRSYGGYASDRNRERRRERERNSDRYRCSGRVDPYNIVLRNRGDAEIVKDRMCDIISKDGYVTVLDFLDMIGEGEETEIGDDDYGWVRTRDIDIRRVSDGWLIDLPEARNIRR